MAPADNVHLFPGATPYDMPVGVMLDAAKTADLKGVVVVGERPDGKLFFSSSFADGADALWWLECAKMALMKLGEDGAGTDQA